jgi:hypothetical protein
MRIEKEILKIYEELDLSKKLIKEVTDIYDNVDFKDNVVGSSTPSKDNINTALLSDIQTAAKNAGVIVDITTAVTGHRERTSSGHISRHMSGNAVDISIINGRPVGPSTRGLVDKFVAELVRLGYEKDKESNFPKSVITYRVPGHETHIHVSNINRDSSDYASSENSAAEDAYTYATSDKTSSSMPSYAPVVEDITSREKLQEQSSFGKNVSNRYGRVIIPKDNNPKIKSPISGKINTKKYFPNCQNQVTVENTDDKTIYLQFCGISNPSVRDGDIIDVGDVLGNTDSDVEVLMYDSRWNRVNIPASGLKIKKKDEDRIDTKKKSSEPEYWDPLTVGILGAPLSVFQDKYDETGKRTEKRYGGVADKQQVDPWILNFLKDPLKRKKVNENIDRIKKIL